MTRNASGLDRGWRRWVRWKLFVFALPAVALITIHISLKLKIDAELESIRKAGMPVTLAELNEWYTAVPASENGALLYGKAFAALYLDEQSRGLLHVESTNSLNQIIVKGSDRAAAISQLLATNHAALSLLHDAATLRKSRYPVDMRDGFATRLPHLQSAQDASRILVLQVTSQITSGNTEAAVQAICDCICLADSMSQEPLEISALTCASILERSMDGLEFLLANSELTSHQIARLSATLEMVENSPNLGRALVGQRCMALAAFDYPVSEFLGQRPKFSAESRMFIQKASGIWDRERLMFLQFAGESIRATRLSIPQRMKVVHRLAQLTDEKHDTDSEVVHFINGHSIGMLLLPSVTASHNTVVEIHAHLVTTKAALGIQRYRADHDGELPRTLSQLVPQYLATVPSDPFDGKSIRYEPVGTGFVIYSIGADGEDNGGRPAAGWHQPYDVIFRIK
jgi:hypothetical protein